MTTKIRNLTQGPLTIPGKQKLLVVPPGTAILDLRGAAEIIAALGGDDVVAGMVELTELSESIPTSGVIYVRPYGNDRGDGSTARPYRTLQRAMLDVPEEDDGIARTIDLDDIDEVLPTGWTLPVFKGCTPQGWDFSPTVPQDYATAAVKLRAGFRDLLAIESSDIVAQVANATTGHITVQTSLVLTPSALRGKLVMGEAFGDLFSVVDNDASDILTAAPYPLTAPLRIVEPTVILRNTDASNYNYPTVTLPQTTQSVCFFGIDIRKGPNGTPGLAVAGTATILLGCTIEGLRTAGVGNLIYSCALVGGVLDLSGGAAIYYCALLGTNGGVAPLGSVETFLCVIDGAVGEGFGVVRTYQGGGALRVDTCLVQNAVAAGIIMYGVGRSAVQNCDIKDNGTDGILVVACPWCHLYITTGVGNGGVGLRVTAGGLIAASDGCDITGTGGDFKVGGNAVGTWAAFYALPAPRYESDFVIDGSRLTQ